MFVTGTIPVLIPEERIWNGKADLSLKMKYGLTNQEDWETAPEVVVRSTISDVRPFFWVSWMFASEVDDVLS